MRALKRVCNLVCLLLLVVSARALADWPCSAKVTVPVATDAGNQWNVRLATDGGDGAIMAWQDRRDGLNDKIYVQKLSSSGVPLWAQGGVQLAATGGFQYYPQLVADGQGGAFIVWQDNRYGVDYDAEDELLITPLEHCFEQIGQCELFHQEHEEIDQSLLLVREAKRLSKARELLLAAVVASRKHFDKEERIVFPMAEGALKDDTLEELGRAWIDQRKEPVGQ